MLAVQHRLRQQLDFQRVFKEGKVVYSGLFFLKFCPNSLNKSRVGFIVDTKVSKKAVLRNIIKRRMRAAAEKNLNRIKKGFDLVFVAKSDSKGAGFREIKNELEILVEKAGLIV